MSNSSRRLIAGLALALFAAAAARAARSRYSERLQALQDEAAAQRKKLGLDADREKLYAQYPTPEVRFEGDGVPLNCGESHPVVVEGTYTKETAFVVRRDDVIAQGAKLQDDGWHATLQAAPDALPGNIEIEAVTPVSGASRSVRVGEVRGLLTLSLQFADGWSAQLTPKADGSHEARWKKGAAERTTVARVSASPSHLEVGFAPPPEVAAQDQEHAQQLMQNAFSPELQAVLKKMQECGKLAQAEQLACIQKLQPEMMAASEANKKRLDQQNEQFQSAQPRDAWGCRQVELRGPMSKLTGTADCAQPIKVTGTATCAPMPAE